MLPAGVSPHAVIAAHQPALASPARRFMVQNAVRWEAETGRVFEPLSVDVGAATNVLVSCSRY